MVATPILSHDRVEGAVVLLSAAAESLASAHWARTLHGRSAGTRLAVLRAAAAVLSVRAQPGVRRAGTEGTNGPLDMWRLLPQVAPELSEWAQFFGSVLPEDTHRATAMSVREVDDLLRQGEEFVQLVAGLLGLPPVPVTGELTSLTPGGHG